jgi:hypothetical protein
MFTMGGDALGTWTAPSRLRAVRRHDVAAARTFYEVFGLPVHYGTRSRACSTSGPLVNLLLATEADELSNPPWWGADVRAGARMQLAIAVDDVDAVCARGWRYGVTLLNGPVDRRGVSVRRASPTRLRSHLGNRQVAGRYISIRVMSWK